ncbi:uncharacterized protein LOC100367073, partial [Saccoglossus kowalevskii]|uniref:Myosin-2 heavy chain-like n=1 Tax=Saccoglossus kowalevskii TaxID=10224 RepID=A0ABM0MEN5_SACKO
NFISHINGKQHATILADKPLPAVECKKVISDLTLFPYYCDICDVNCNHPSLLQVHVDGIKHKKLEAEIKMIEINEPILVEKKSSTDHIEWFCYKCQVDCKTSEMLKSHVKDSSHTQKKVQDKKVKDQVAALIKATNRVSLVDRLKKSIIPKTTGNRNQCLLCNVSVSGDTMMHRSGETHLANLDFHRKLAKLKNLLQQLGNARSGASALKLAVAYEERLSSDELVPPCKLCDLHDTDPKNFEKHINHQNHKDIKHFVETAVAIKKGIGSKDGDKIMAVIQEKEDNLFFEKPESTKWYCSICKELIRCPYEIHNIADSKHKGNKFLLEELVIALQDLKQLDFVKATIKMDPDEVKKETVVIEKKEEIETTVIKRKLFTEGKKDELSKYKVPKLGKDSKSEQRIKSESASDNAIESNKPKSIGTCSSTLDVSNVNKELGEDTTPATVEEHIDLSDMDELLIIDEFMSEPDEERNATDDSNKQTDDEHLDLNTSVGKDNSDPVLRKIQVKKSTTDEIESQSTDNFTTPKKDAMDKDSRSDSEKKTLAWQGKLTPLDEDKKEATLEAKQPDEVKIPTHDIPSTDEMNCQSNDFTLETKKQNEEKDSICDILSTDDTTHQRQNKEATSKAKQQNEEKDSICDIQSGKEHQKLNKDEIIKMKNCKVILVDIGKDIKKMCESIKHDGDEGDFGKYVDFSTMVTVDEIEDEEEDFSDGEEFMVMDEVGSSEDETTKKEFKMVQKYDKNRAI